MEEPVLKKPAHIGRDQELSKLTHYLENALQGKGSTVLIAGEAGIGKTRLVTELKEFASGKGARIIQGWCLSESLEPIMPIRTALRDTGLLHLVSDDPPPRVISAYLIYEGGKLMTKAERTESGLDSDIYTSMLEAVGNFVQDSLSMMDAKGGASLRSLVYGDYTILIEATGNLSLSTVIEGTNSEFLIEDMKRVLREMGDDYVWSGSMADALKFQPNISWFLSSGKYDGQFLVEDPKIKQENLFDNVLLGIQRASLERPLLLFLDDLQWADPSTLNLLHYLSRNIRESRILIVGTYRPEDILQGFDGKPHQLELTMQNMSRENLLDKIELNRLDGDSTQSLINSVLGEVKAGPGFYDRIFEETGGTPFFVLEILKLLAEEGAFVRDDEGAWALMQDTDNLHIPTKVYDVVRRRLDRLTREQIEILECASVVGEEFGSDVVGKVTGLSRIQLLKNLSEIEKAHRLLHFIEEKYRFDHAKIREVLYDGIGQELRREYHREVGNAIAELRGDEHEDTISELAYHYYMARDDRAGGYLIKAGDSARAKYANDEALRLYGYAVGLVDGGEKAKVLEKRADIQLLIGEYDASILNYRAAEELAKDNESKASMLRKQGKAFERKGGYDKSLETMARAKELVDASGIEYGRILLAEAFSYFRKGDYDRSMALNNEVLSIVERITGGERETAEALSIIGMIYQVWGENDPALENMEKSRAIFESLGDMSGVASALNTIGLIYNLTGEFDKSLEVHNQGLALKEKIGDRQGAARSLNNMGNVYGDMGDLETALEKYKLSLEMRQKIGERQGVALSLNNIGNIHYEMGELDVTLDCYQRGLEILESIGEKQGIALMTDNTGIIYYLRGEFDKALDYHSRGLEIREAIGDKQGLALSLENTGNVYHEIGELDTALDFHTRSLEICLAIDDKILTIHNYCALADIRVELGDVQKALDFAEKAVGTAADIGAREEEGMGLRALGIVHREMKDWQTASDEFSKASLLFEEMGSKLELTRVFYEIALLWKARGEPAKAKENLDKAIAGFERMGMGPWVEKCRKVLD